MKIHKLDIDKIISTDERCKHICFIKPVHSKLFRVISIPEDLADHEELLQVLQTLAIRFHKPTGILFFHFDPDEDEDIMQTLLYMGIESVFARLIEDQKVVN